MLIRAAASSATRCVVGASRTRVSSSVLLPLPVPAFVRGGVISRAMASRAKTSSQLQDFAKEKKIERWRNSEGSDEPPAKRQKVSTPDVLTTSHGHPVDDKKASQTVGEKGPMLLQDFVYTDEMAHFDRERIPERVVHAKGAGAFGYFEVTHDITKYCKAKVFEKVGKKTPIAVRFSTVGGESGSADTARDPRGFAVKFYTEDGNWDLVGNNTPIFFIRDPLFFPSFIHTQKRNPSTHLKDPDMFWDFISLRPETTHQPSYSFQIQVMTFEQAEKFKFNPFDLTKVWSQKEYPLIPVGKMVLDRNPKNYFAEVEQIAFCPIHMPPGIEASPDKMLQGRLYSYSDTHRHRLGTNYHHIPVNAPLCATKNYQRDGPMCTNDNQAGAPNYFPNSFAGPEDDLKHANHPQNFSGDVKRYRTDDTDNFTQVGIFYREVLKEEERTRLVENIAGHLKDAAKFIQERAVKNFASADPEYGARIAALLKKYKK